MYGVRLPANANSYTSHLSF